MKRILYLIPFIALLCFCSVSLYAQNWNLLQQKERYHFQRVDDSIPMFTMFVDSFLVSNADTIFYLNRFFLPCDTCSNGALYLDNQPGFLQREWIKKSEGLQVIQNPETFFIQVTGTIGSEWWFDAAKTQKAKVISRQNEMVFDMEDSVFTFLIDDIDTIKLSKNYGFLQFFDYRLSGLEYAKLGKCLPGFNEFFDFEVGDVFMHEHESISFENVDFHTVKNLSKKTINELNKKEDTVIVKYDVLLRTSYYSDNWPIDDTYSSYETVTTYTKNQFPQMFYYPNQSIYIQEMSLFEPMYTFCKTGIENNRYFKQYGGVASTVETDLEFPSDFFIQDNTFNEIFIPIDTYESWFYKFEQGLGLVEDWFMIFEISEHTSLIGAVKGGDTIGNVLSDSYLLKVNTVKNDKAEIFPNPVRNKLTINTTAKLKAIKVYNLLGELLYTVYQSNKTVTIDMFNFKPGVYLIELISDSGSIEQYKIIKQ